MSDRSGVTVVLLVPVLLGSMLIGAVVVAVGQPAAAACATSAVGAVDTAAIPAGAEVAGFGQAQLVNAAAIAAAATRLGIGGDGQLLGIQTAIGESSLVNLDHGDGAVNPEGTIADSVGLFQQQSSWGSLADREDPTTAAALFFARLKRVVGWQQMVPTLAINAVQGNQDPNYYARFAGPASAVVRYLAELPTPTRSTATGAPTASSTSRTTPVGGSRVGCGDVSSSARAAATVLMRAIGAGRLTVLEPRYRQELADVAAGTQTAACGLDVRTLQIIQLALATFQTVGISDLNRRCTGSLLGAGDQSSHWINGGGDAVDFAAFDGSPLTGGDPASLRFLAVLDPALPPGARAGQAECRTPQAFVHLTEFDDTCNHLHVDVTFTGAAALQLPG